MPKRPRPAPYVDKRASATTTSAGQTKGQPPPAAPEDATYLLSTANPELPQAVDLASKTTGVLANNPSGTLAINALTENGVAYGTADGDMSSTAAGATGTVLSGVTGGPPVFLPSTTAVPVNVDEGGTGRSILTTGNLLMGDDINPVAEIAPSIGSTLYGDLVGSWRALPAGAGGSVFTMGSGPNLPQWSSKLGTESGGTNSNIVAVLDGDLLVGDATSGSFQSVNTVAAAGEVLTSNGVLSKPTFQALPGPTTVPVPADEGGTGQSFLTAHGLLVGQGVAAVAAVGPAATGSYLGSQGASADPAWVPGNLVSKIPIDVAEGGSGATTITNHGIVVGQGASPIATIAPAAAGSFLASNGVSADPIWSPGALVSKVPVEVSEGGTGLTNIGGALNAAIMQGYGSSVSTLSAGLTPGAIVVSDAGGGSAYAWEKLERGTSNQVLMMANVVAGTGVNSKPQYRTIFAADPSSFTNGHLITQTASGLDELASAGTSGQVLTSNGAGVAPSFQAVSATVTTSMVTSVYTTSGSFTINANAKYVRVTMIGGGGGGGGAVDSSGSRVCVGSGGAAGMFYQGYHNASVFSGASRAVTIGAGGGSATDGGDTSIATATSPMIVRGGKAGTTGTAGSICLVNSTYNTLGGSGPLNYTVFDNKTVGCGSSFAAGYAYGAPGGESVLWGRGGEARYCTPGDGGLNGNGASGYGGGGGGAASFNNAATRTGGSGKSGIVIIDQFVFS